MDYSLFYISPANPSGLYGLANLFDFGINPNTMAILGSSDFLSAAGGHNAVWGMVCVDGSSNKYIRLFKSSFWSASCGGSTPLSASDWETLNTNLGGVYDYTFTSNTVFPIDSNNVVDLSTLTDFSGSLSNGSSTPLQIKFILSVPDNSGSGGGDSPSGDSGDYSSITTAIYTLGAVMIVLAMFSVIYRMFINRRVRN